MSVTARFDEYEAEWIKKAGNAFMVLKLITDHRYVEDQGLSPETIANISQLGALLEGIYDLGERHWREFNTPEKLASVEQLMTKLQHDHEERVSVYLGAIVK
jgi:hypothetical protein